jgi:hypothetical protein
MLQLIDLGEIDGVDQQQPGQAARGSSHYYKNR